MPGRTGFAAIGAALLTALILSAPLGAQTAPAQDQAQDQAPQNQAADTVQTPDPQAEPGAAPATSAETVPSAGDGDAAETVPAQDRPAAAAGAAPAPAAAPGPGAGPSKSATAGQASGSKSITITPAPGQDPIDYATWEQLAARAERAVAEGTTSNNGLSLLRGQIVDWRSKFQAAQNGNAPRLQSLRDQITALGPAPAEGAAESPEITERRARLGEQLQTIEGPRLAAEEAYRRANGLVAEIDQVIRDRQAEQLLKIWPTPVNPENWVIAGTALTAALGAQRAELAANLARAERHTAMIDAAPVSALFLLLALVLIFRGRPLVERLSSWLTTSAHSPRWRRVLGFAASLGQIVLPVTGVWLIARAATLTTMPGFLAQQILLILPAAGFFLFQAHWLAGRLFPRNGEADRDGLSFLGLEPQAAAAMRRNIALSGAVQGLEILRASFLPAAQQPEAAVPVLELPLVLAMSLLLWRIGGVLNGHIATSPTPEEGDSFRTVITRLLGKLLIAIALAGPFLALIGYTTAASALVFRTGASLALIGLVMVLVQFISDLWRGVTGAGEEAGEGGLLPVLAGFMLSLASLPLFSLIWGARVQDLGELWNKFSEGYSFGDTRISPSTLVYLLALFLVGYAITRLVQGALRSTILPRTRLDQGGRNAVVAGVGYVGIFISALVAISAAGLDLSNLAILASALSVGIGFGLQNIVQNFVSGIILLIERPVSEGDWIEVGGVSGTVKSISVRSTRIQTFDRSDVIVPNGNLVAQQVTNWTRFSLTGRVIVPLSVKFGNDSRRVAEVLQEIAEAQPLALLNPPPAVLMTGFGADQLNFEVRVLIRDVNFGSQVRSEICHQIIGRFAAEGITLAGTPASSPSRIEDVATVLEAIGAASPEQIARIAPQPVPPDGATKGETQ